MVPQWTTRGLFVYGRQGLILLPVLQHRIALPFAEDRMSKKKTTEEFIAEAVAKHGDKYSYDEVVYTKAKDKVKIWCKVHECYFLQTPDQHCSKGNGCPKCKADKTSDRCKYTVEDFLRKAKEAHGDKYDYSKVEYKGSTIPVIVVCPKHSDFSVIPTAHWGGAECAKCSEEKGGKRFLMTDEEFKARVAEIYGDTLDFTHDTYGSKKKIKVFCNIHKEFFYKTAEKLLHRNQGCPLCGRERISKSRAKDIEHFLSRAIAVHGSEKYDYSEVVYTGVDNLVKIWCNEHKGFFMQTPDHHARIGNGCPTCAAQGFDKNKLGKVYVLSSDDMFKVGITNRDVDLRVYKINRDSPQKFSTVFYKEMDGVVADKVETLLLKWLRGLCTPQPTEKFDGYTECFYKGKTTICDVINRLEEFEKQIQLTQQQGK